MPNAGTVWGIVLVPSVSHALRAEKLIRAAGRPCKLIPTPRQLSSDCGTAVRFRWEDRGEIGRLLREAGLVHEGIFRLS